MQNCKHPISWLSGLLLLIHRRDWPWTGVKREMGVSVLGHLLMCRLSVFTSLKVRGSCWDSFSLKGTRASGAQFLDSSTSLGVVRFKESGHPTGLWNAVLCLAQLIILPPVLGSDNSAGSGSWVNVLTPSLPPSHCEDRLEAVIFSSCFCFTQMLDSTLNQEEISPASRQKH